MAARRRALICCNPAGGQGTAPRAASRAQARLGAAGWQVERFDTRAPGHARERARASRDEGWDAWCVAGGDGTLREVVDGLLDGRDRSAVPLVVLPAGTGNALAADLGLARADDALDRLLAGRQRMIDVLRVTTGPDAVQHACDLVGVGLAASAAIRAERLRLLGAPRYLLGSLLAALQDRPIRLELRVGDGAPDVLEALLVMASNTRHTGTGLEVAPRALLDDGLLDLVVARGAGRLARLAALWSLLRRREDRAGLLERRQASRVRIAAGAPIPINLDGDLVRAAALEIEVLPGALLLLA